MLEEEADHAGDPDRDSQKSLFLTFAISRDILQKGAAFLFVYSKHDHSKNKMTEECLRRDKCLFNFQHHWNAVHRVRPRSPELCNWMPYSVFFTFVSDVCKNKLYLSPLTTCTR